MPPRLALPIGEGLALRLPLHGPRRPQFPPPPLALRQRNLAHQAVELGRKGQMTHVQQSSLSSGLRGQAAPAGEEQARQSRDPSPIRPLSLMQSLTPQTGLHPAESAASSWPALPANARESIGIQVSALHPLRTQARPCVPALGDV